VQVLLHAGHDVHYQDWCIPFAALFSGIGWAGKPCGPRPLAPPYRYGGRTALHYAAYYGNRQILRELIAAKANVDARADYGRAFPFGLGG
jgi:hypothetical protein